MFMVFFKNLSHCLNHLNTPRIKINIHPYSKFEPTKFIFRETSFEVRIIVGDSTISWKHTEIQSYCGSDLSYPFMGKIECIILKSMWKVVERFGISMSIGLVSIIRVIQCNIASILFVPVTHRKINYANIVMNCMDLNLHIRSAFRLQRCAIKKLYTEM